MLENTRRCVNSSRSDPDGSDGSAPCTRAGLKPAPTTGFSSATPVLSSAMDEPARPKQILIALERLGVRFGKLQAIKNVSFELRAGDLLGLIGPNGSGKTTLLRAITGIQPLSQGVVQIMGEPFLPASNHLLRHLGFTPDTPAVYEELTVSQFLRFIAKGYDLTPAQTGERIDFWLEKVWLTEKADQKIKTLSRGMRQRIGIARTLLPNPAIILLDEPAAGIDPAGRVQFRQLLCDLREQGKALIVSSHILADMSEYCTHIGIMAQGEMIQFGTVAQVAGQANGLRCRYTILLSRPVSGVQDMLAKMDGIDGIQIDRDRILLEYGSRRDQAAELLAELVARHLPIASFTANAPGLEEAYLRAGIRQVD